MAGTKIATQDPATRLFLPPCRVCGDKAAGFHYGVNTCEACKGFFHRSLRRYKEYKCRANRTTGYCEYKPGKRKSCQYCRYQRCLNAGMSKDAIKTGRYTYIKRTEDTQEIKRLQDMEVVTTPVGKVVESSLFSVSTPRNCNAAEFKRKGCNMDTLDMDFIAEDEFLSPSMTESDLSCSSREFTTSESRSRSNSSNCGSRKYNIYRKFSNNGCQSNKAQSATENVLSSKDNSASRLSDNGHMICTNQSLFFSKFGFSASPDSYCDQDDNVIVCASESEFTSYLDGEDPDLGSHTYLEVLDQCHPDQSSIIHILLSDSGKIKDHAQKNYINSLESNRKKKPVVSGTDTHNAPQSVDSSLHVYSGDSCGSAFLNINNNSGSNSKDLLGPSFDLFPDISFCLDGNPVSSPISLSDAVNSSSVLTPSVLLSPMTSESPESNSMSSVPSPGMIVLNMDSGKRLKVGDDFQLVTDLCHTPESNYQMEEVVPVQNEDNITLQIMEEYTQGLDLLIDSHTETQAPTPVQTLLISSSPQDLSLSPQSSSGSDFDDLNEASPTSKLINRVKHLQLSDIPELYSDMDAVLDMLMASHKENIGDFNYLSKEEMIAQQKAHCESCQLKNQTFGDLGFLPDHEYDDIYSVTGIDVDNRRMIIQKYLSRMERCVRGLVQFAKTIPGFSILDINTQVELIKLARSEIAIFTVYPTVNLELGVTLGLTGEQWACQYEAGCNGHHIGVTEYMIFSDKLQKMHLTQEEEVLLKAILVVTTDRDNSINSPLADAIRWQLILCLKHKLAKHREQPSMFLARCILALAQSRTVTEKFKEFIRHLKMEKYSSIEQNPLLWEIYSGILHEKEKEANWELLCQHIGVGKAGMWSPCLLG